MEILNYIVENALILIPALLVIGQIIKGIEKIPDKYIPLILLVFGIGGAIACVGVSVDAVIQGVYNITELIFSRPLYRAINILLFPYTHAPLSRGAFFMPIFSKYF